MENGASHRRCWKSSLVGSGKTSIGETYFRGRRSSDMVAYSVKQWQWWLTGRQFRDIRFSYNTWRPRIHKLHNVQWLVDMNKSLHWLFSPLVQDNTGSWFLSPLLLHHCSLCLWLVTDYASRHCRAASPLRFTAPTSCNPFHLKWRQRLIQHRVTRTTIVSLAWMELGGRAVSPWILLNWRRCFQILVFQRKNQCFVIGMTQEQRAEVLIFTGVDCHVSICITQYVKCCQFCRQLSQRSACHRGRPRRV
jgi:hypothetical protein